MCFRQAFCRLCKGVGSSASFRIKTCNSLPNAGKLIVSSENDFGDRTWTKRRLEVLQWALLSGPAAIILGTWSSPSLAEDVSTESSSTNATSTADFSGLSKLEDGSMVSNEHTAKWRIFTDNGRDYFMKGNIDQAEKFFVSALQEAKEGFGERDAHVASACNNLAELYKIKKDYDKAEPLYLEAVNILEEYFGINDIRVGAALHNLGQFYHAQQKLEQARVCYERALKIKQRVLGEAHTEYAHTMYFLGSVFYLEGKEKEAEDLIANSIEILEAVGQGETVLCVRRMQYLAQMYSNSKRFAEAEILLRKTLHIVEASKGWKSLDTVVVAERLALTLEALGRLREAEKLLERCLDARGNLLPHEHIQTAADMLYIARVKMLISNKELKTDISQAVAELDKAKNLLHDSIRVAQILFDRFQKQKRNRDPRGEPKRTGKDAHSAAVILLQSLNALGSLEIMKEELLGSREHIAAESAFRQCISTFQKFESENAISDSHQLKSECLSCLRNLYNLISNGSTSESSKVKQMKDKIQRIEGELLKAGNS